MAVYLDVLKRANPLSDKFEAHDFHHLEFFAGDATSASKRFMGALGVELAAKSDISTGNDVHSSYLMETGTCRMLFTAPYKNSEKEYAQTLPFPGFTTEKANDFFVKHGFTASVVGISVSDVQASFDTLVANGAIVVLAPVRVTDANPDRGYADMAEVSLYGEGDVSLRLVDVRNFKGTFLPNFVDVVAPGTKLGKYGIDRIDHIVGNVHNLQNTLKYLKNMTVSVSYPPSCVIA